MTRIREEEEVVRRVLAGRSTESAFDLAWFSCLSSERLCSFDLHRATYIFK